MQKNQKITHLTISTYKTDNKMKEILKAKRKTMQISRVFIIILLLNEITYDFFSLCRANAFLTISWSTKKPLVHSDKGMVHLVVVEPDLYLYTLAALF
jgi:hypothetical protein